MVAYLQLVVVQKSKMKHEQLYNFTPTQETILKLFE